MGVSGFVVVDASLAVKWLVEEDDSGKAHSVLESWVTQDVTCIAPYLLPFEVANALHRRVMQGELSIDNSARLMTRLLGLEFELPPRRSTHNMSYNESSQLGVCGARWKRRKNKTTRLN